ncbi:MAG TPA: hypothetical protein VIT02_08560 [Burkholderiaceae bacterium]
MPYYVFRTAGLLGLPERLGEAPGYRDAKALMTEIRAQADDPASIRMVFAANEIEAADLLTQPREPDPSLAGDDD